MILAGILIRLSSGLCAAQSLDAPDFTIHKLSGQRPGHTVLVIGGIQGDEPGGFNAASLIVTHYQILSGNVWVVPNLNFLSIIQRSRGVHGDLNRKFDRLHPDDPEYETIQRIKKLITSPEVDMVLNLHDGSGFFRHEYKDKYQNPNRWGQCVIIDQDRMGHNVFSELKSIAQKAVTHVNANLIKPDEFFLVNNTKTAKGNQEMEKTLTWFAIKNKKPAFGLEASKSFLTHKRAYYHLTAIESFLHQAGIDFTRSFELTRREIKKAIDEDIQVALNNRKILLKIENARKRLNYIPLKKNAGLEFSVNNPLMTIIENGGTYSVIHGNRRMTHLSPQYMDYDFSISGIDMIIDGKKKNIPFGRIIGVKDWFRVEALQHHRVNIIGFTMKNKDNETGISVSRDQIAKKYSIDKKGEVFRVEVYHKDKFSGMILVDFSGQPRRKLNLAFRDEDTEPNLPALN